MRWLIGLTFAGFLGILGVAWIVAERARPELIDIDPATVQLNGSPDPSLAASRHRH